MASPWTIAGDVAHLQIGLLRAEIQLAWPQHGMHGVALQGEALSDPAAFFLGVRQSLDLAEQLQECYIRGADLVMTGAETDDRPIRPQIYWRAVAFPEEQPLAYGVDLILSAQTSQLHSDPTMYVESCAPAIDQPIAVEVAEGAKPHLIRWPTPHWSFVQAIHPSDFSAVEIAKADDAGVRLRHRLFDPGLEKGVIRRARLRGLFVPRERDEELAAASYAEFIAQELPLTT